MSKMTMAVLTAIAATAFNLPAATAQAPADSQEPATKLPGIVVTTVRREQAPPPPSGPVATDGQSGEIVGSQAANQPVSVAVVPRQQIEQTPAQSIDDVLRTVPSVNVPLAASYQVHPTANSFSMRGLGGIRALVMVDGVPINDPFFGYVQWNRVPLNNIERVEIVRGGGSPLWGNYAMGGVVNIITRVPGKNEVGVQAGYGSYQTYRTDTYADVVVSNGFKVRANFDSWGTAGFRQIDPSFGPIYVPTSFDAINGQVTAYFAPDSTLRGYLRFNYHENDQQLTTPLQTNDQRIYDFSGSVTKVIGPSDITVTAFHEHSRFLTNNTGQPFGVPVGFGEFLQNRHTTPVDATGASVQWSTRFNSVFRLFSIGADYHLIDGKDSAAIFDEFGTQVRTDVGRGKQQFLGAFVQANVFPTENLEILASARFQNFLNFDGFDGVGGLGNVPDNSVNSFDPRVSIRYAFTPSFAVRGAAYTSFRAPNLDNLYRAFSVPFGVFEPNSQLRPEKLRGVEAGFDVKWGTVAATQVTAYYSEIKDLITFRNLDASELPAGFFFGTRNINAGRAEVKGIEANTDWFIQSNLKATFGYAYSDSRIVENEFDPASVGNQQAGIPKQQASVGLTYLNSHDWRVSTRLRWLDESWGDNAHTLPIDSHFVVDASLAYKLSKSSELFVNIENLFDRRYVVDNSGFNPPLFGTPFTAFAGVRMKFD